MLRSAGRQPGTQGPPWAERGAGSAGAVGDATRDPPATPLTQPQFTGFAFVPDAKEADIDPRLRAFVEAGPPPVYLGFGSMPAPDPQKLLDTAAEVRAQLRPRCQCVCTRSRECVAAGMRACCDLSHECMRCVRAVCMFSVRVCARSLVGVWAWM